MADKYLNLSGLQAFYDELKNHYPTTATSATSASTASYAVSAGAAKSGSTLETAINGKAATTHTHSVKINGLTKTIAASDGTAVDLGTFKNFKYAKVYVTNHAYDASSTRYFLLAEREITYNTNWQDTSEFKLTVYPGPVPKYMVFRLSFSGTKTTCTTPTVYELYSGNISSEERKVVEVRYTTSVVSNTSITVHTYIYIDRNYLQSQWTSFQLEPLSMGSGDRSNDIDNGLSTWSYKGSETYVTSLSGTTVAHSSETLLANIGGNAATATIAAGYTSNGAIATALGNKVDKVSGKGLSTNDFTNAYKSNVDSNTSARHTHSNKSVLDGISANNLVYDCGTGSTSTTDFDNALAAFNAGKWVIIHYQGTLPYYCVGSYSGPGLRFKSFADETSLLKVYTLNWTRGSAPTTGTALEAALVGHTHSNYVPTSRKINGKTLDADITLTSTDIAAASVGPSNPDKDWIELGTFQYNDSNVMFAGLTLAVQFRANDGRNESGILWISTGEYKASGGYSNADVVATFSTVSRRSVTKTERFALYFNALGTTSTSGVKLYAKVQSYSSVYVTPVNAVKGSWVPSMTFLDSEPATKVEVANYVLLKSTPGTGIGQPSTPVYVDAYGQLIPCSGITISSESATDAAASSRIVRRQTFIFTPIGWQMKSNYEDAYNSGRKIILGQIGNFQGCNLRITAFRNSSGTMNLSIRGYTTTSANGWLSGASVMHCGKITVRSANATEPTVRMYSAFDTVGSSPSGLFAFCDPDFTVNAYTQYGTWEGEMHINPNLQGTKDVYISFRMIFRVEATDPNSVIMTGRMQIEAEDDVEFIYT